MLRSSRLALTFAFLAAVPMTASAEAPRGSSPTADSLKVDTVQAVSMHRAVDTMDVLSLNSVERNRPTFETMRFSQKTATDSADGGVRWSPRTQRAIQKTAFDHALYQTFRARDFSAGTFAGVMLDSLVDFAGPDNVRNAAKASGIQSDQFRVVLRAIRDRTPTVDPGDRNRSS